ncbi:MAG: RNA polymerase sigma factor, partial [Parvularculaceae bacterium]|nr:RNA polymerase sigma factor [Parvularculaceae bacterium]
VEDVPAEQLAVRAEQEEAMHYQTVVSEFRALPHNDKVVLALIAIEGLKYDEVATLLDVPIGTVRSRLSRARTRLRERLEKFEDEGTKVAQAV